MRSFKKIKPSRNGKTILPFTEVGKSCSSRIFLTSQTCLLTLFRKISEFTVFKTSSKGELVWFSLGWDCKKKCRKDVAKIGPHQNKVVKA